MLSRQCFLGASRVLATTVGHRHPCTAHRSSQFLVSRGERGIEWRRVRLGSSFRRRSRRGSRGESAHVMDPVPQATSPGYKPANKLHGKVALVTACDSGIGWAVCHCFALVCHTFVKSEEDKDAHGTLQMVKAAKSADAKDPIALPADLGFEENCKMVLEEVENAYGRIDVLVSNAAEQHKSIEEIDEPREGVQDECFLVLLRVQVIVLTQDLKPCMLYFVGNSF